MNARLRAGIIIFWVLYVSFIVAIHAYWFMVSEHWIKQVIFLSFIGFAIWCAVKGTHALRQIMGAEQ